MRVDLSKGQLKLNLDVYKTATMLIPCTHSVEQDKVGKNCPICNEVVKTSYPNTTLRRFAQFLSGQAMEVEKTEESKEDEVEFPGKLPKFIISEASQTAVSFTETEKDSPLFGLVLYQALISIYTEKRTEFANYLLKLGIRSKVGQDKELIIKEDSSDFIKVILKLDSFFLPKKEKKLREQFEAYLKDSDLMHFSES